MPLPDYEVCMTEKFIITFLWNVAKICTLQTGAALSADFKTDVSAMILTAFNNDRKEIETIL